MENDAPNIEHNNNVNENDDEENNNNDDDRIPNLNDIDPELPNLNRIRRLLRERIRQFQRAVEQRLENQLMAENIESVSIGGPPPIGPIHNLTPAQPSLPLLIAPSAIENLPEPQPFEIPCLDSKSIIDLPNEIMYKILKYLSFDLISKKRIVCRYFNVICSDILNSEFKCLRNTIQQRLAKLKSQMPRRESARRQHPLAREFDIIDTVNMRLSMMHTMFSKHIERSHSSFFAGQVLDEVHRILHYLKVTPVLNFAYKVTDELFDLSTMAVEYFKERIEPTLPEINYIMSFSEYMLEHNGNSSSFEGASNSSSKSCEDNSETSDYSSSKSSFFTSPKSDLPNCNTQDDPAFILRSVPRSVTLTRSAHLRIKKLEARNRKATSAIRMLRSGLSIARKKANASEKQIRKYRTFFDDYDKKLESTCSKLNFVLEELTRCKTEIQYLRSTSNLHSAALSSSAHSTANLSSSAPAALAMVSASHHLATSFDLCDSETVGSPDAEHRRIIYSANHTDSKRTLKRKLEFVQFDHPNEAISFEHNYDGCNNKSTE